MRPSSASGSLPRAVVSLHNRRVPAESESIVMVTFKEYAQYDALGLGELIASRQVTPQEVLEAAIERIEAVNPRINAVVQKTYDDARAVVGAGLPPGPLAGVPYLMKDLGAWQKGVRIGYGSRVYDGFVADHDFTLVQRYKAAGVV